MFFKRKQNKDNLLGLFHTTVDHGIYKVMNRINSTISVEIESILSDNVESYSVPEVMKNYESLDSLGKKAYLYQVYMNLKNCRNLFHLHFIQTFNRGIILLKPDKFKIQCGFGESEMYLEAVGVYLNILSILVDLTKEKDVKKFIEDLSGWDDFSIYTLYNAQVAFFNSIVTSTIDNFYNASWEKYGVINDNMLTMITCFDSAISDKDRIVHYRIGEAISKLTEFKLNDSVMMKQSVASVLDAACKKIPTTVKDDLIFSLFVDKKRGRCDVLQIARLCESLKYGNLKHIEELFEFQEYVYKYLMVENVTGWAIYKEVVKETVDNFYVMAMYKKRMWPVDILDEIPYSVSISDFIPESLNEQFGDTVYVEALIHILSKIDSLKKKTIYKYHKKY